MDYKEKYEYWQTSDVVDAQTKHALSSLAEYAALRGVTITLEDFDGFLQPFARTYPLLWFMEHVPGRKTTALRRRHPRRGSGQKQ